MVHLSVLKSIRFQGAGRVTEAINRIYVRTYVYTHVRPQISFSDRLRRCPLPATRTCARSHAPCSRQTRISKLAPRRYVRTCVLRTYVRRSLRAYVRPRCAARYMRASDMCCSMLVVGARSAHSPSVSVPCFRAHARVYVRTQHCTYVRAQKKTVHEVRHAVARASVRTYVRTFARRPARCRC